MMNIDRLTDPPWMQVRRQVQDERRQMQRARRLKWTIGLALLVWLGAIGMLWRAASL